MFPLQHLMKFIADLIVAFDVGTTIGTNIGTTIGIIENNVVNMDIKHSSCCDLVEYKVNFWLTNSGELVLESELLSRLYDYF